MNTLPVCQACEDCFEEPCRNLTGDYCRQCQAILAWVNTVIGEDDPIEQPTFTRQQSVYANNTLRAEQRRRAGL